MGSEREQVIDTFHTTVHTLCRNNEKDVRGLRYMQKNGRFPMAFWKAPGDWSIFLIDIFTTLVEVRWRIMLLAFSFSYIISWILFGLLYWLIAHVNGDISEKNDRPCVENVRSFTGSFLFSMETQATIGYGFRGMTENCMVAIVVVTIQDVFSCFIDTIIIGIVVAKMASARKRAQTVGFSSCAVVNLQNGVLCLSWRLGDFRNNHILEGIARAQLVRCVRQPFPSIMMSYQDINILNQDIVLATPITITHKLDSSSPFYRLGPDDLMEDNFELVVSFTFTGDSTGMLHQTRTCYTPADIHWGQRFQDMLKAGKKRFTVDYTLFNETTWVPVPMVSAQAYDRLIQPTENHPHVPSVIRNGHNCQINTDREEVIQTYL
ncbi:inward rectifier potassium channel 16-like [Nothobranchius furzeri]|uniref:Inward rectifier potassium channel 16-like n=1 Tax=Nothobranchius furzeri TaxID=105023 RepID=A0A8C6M1T5_NOTFU|nr:inward rectifier potassium channel 16-like [Nothobranchius furzeri]KAF7225498.1 inward rectifier potassium channel 16-like [Nothobranchius furzeri]